MSFKYHGNYCGPGYTGGSFGPYRYDVAPIDDLDAKCRQHDWEYSVGNIVDADQKLVADTKMGLSKEGLLNLGFRAKDLLWNPVFEGMPKKTNKQVKMQPAQAPKKPQAAVRGGKRLKAVMLPESVPDAVDNLYLPSTYSLSSGNRSRARRVNQKSWHEEDEYIAEVSGSTSTTVPAVTTYAVNPGQSATFPWLAKDALQWEKWGFEYITFYYKPEVSEFNNQGSQGKVILGINYDATDAVPTTKQQLENLQPHVDGLPSHQMALTMDPSMATQRLLYVRPGNLPGQADIRLYDAANLFVATVGCNGTGVCGELHVKYKIWYEIPILAATLVSAPINNSVGLYASAQAGEAGPASGAAKQLLLTQTVTNGIGIANSSGYLTVPAGNYLIDAQVQASCSLADLTVLEISIQLPDSGGYLNPSNSSSASAEIVSPSGVNFLGLNIAPWYVSFSAPTRITLNSYNVYSGGSLTLWGTVRVVSI